MLILLPDLTFPVSRQAANALMVNVVQLNHIDAGLGEPLQRGLGLLLAVHELHVKSGGRLDYRTVSGHERLKQDAETFCPSGSALSTRKSDMEAGHLGLDFTNVQLRLKAAGMPLMPSDVNALLGMCADLFGLSVLDERRLSLFLDYLSKRKVG